MRNTPSALAKPPPTSEESVAPRTATDAPPIGCWVPVGTTMPVIRPDGAAPGAPGARPPGGGPPWAPAPTVTPALASSRNDIARVKLFIGSPAGMAAKQRSVVSGNYPRPCDPVG